MTTREEFEATLERYGLAAFGALPIESLHDAKDALLAAYDAQAQTIKTLEAALRKITELRPIDALGSALERAQAIARVALREAGL